VALNHLQRLIALVDLYHAIEHLRRNMREQHLSLLDSAQMDELVGLAGYMSRLGRPAGQAVQTGDHEDSRTNVGDHGDRSVASALSGLW